MLKQLGFTLIELMIVVAVIAALSAIALPKYQNFVVKGKAGAAYATATALKTNIESYIAENGSFPTTSSDVDATPFSLGTLTVGSNKVEVSVTDGPSITLDRNETTSAWSCTLTTSAAISINGCS
ncbi:MAG: pilin [Aliivibrio sp.]|uniref:pilin n=1 Tax=Aliivibrio sp. TaxID=1872443 RepID=UPI001A494A21|nr:pilin [Aliivibrio sp.]